MFFYKFWLTLCLCLLTHASLNANTKLKSSEKRVRIGGNQPQTVNFEDATITGDFKSPFASLLNSQDPNLTGGFSEMRTHWRDLNLMTLMHVTP